MVRPPKKHSMVMVSSKTIENLQWSLQNHWNLQWFPKKHWTCQWSSQINILIKQGHQELSGKSEENKSFQPNRLAPSIYIMIALGFFSLDRWEIRIHLLWEKCFNIPHHSDPHLNQTKFNELLPLAIADVLTLLHHPRDPCSLHDMTDC